MLLQYNTKNLTEEREVEKSENIICDVTKVTVWRDKREVTFNIKGECNTLRLPIDKTIISGMWLLNDNYERVRQLI